MMEAGPLGSTSLATAYLRLADQKLYVAPLSVVYTTVASQLNLNLGPNCSGGGTFVPPDGCCYAIPEPSGYMVGAPVVVDTSAFSPPFSLVGY